MAVTKSIRQFYEDAAATEPTASAAVVSALRKAILDGLIRGGTRLLQDELAAALGVSRMPIREAIRLLEAEGLVVFEHHRGAIVSMLSVADVLEISELRVALECLALTWSLPKLTGADFERAQAILDASTVASSPIEQTVANREFHYLLYAASGRRRLLQQIDGLHLAYERYLRIEHSVLSYNERTAIDHFRILDACRRGNVEVAVGELKQHINDASSLLIRLLETSRLGE